MFNIRPNHADEYRASITRPGWFWLVVILVAIIAGSVHIIFISGPNGDEAAGFYQGLPAWVGFCVFFTINVVVAVAFRKTRLDTFLFALLAVLIGGSAIDLWFL